MSRAACLLLAVSALAGCALGPAPKSPSAEALGVPAAFDGEVDTVSRSADIAPDDADLARWWTTLGDPRLVELVQRALEANPDVAQAAARLAQARALRSQTEAGRWPSLDASTSAGRTGRSDGPEADSASAGVDARWALDLFGGQRRAVQAADADLAAAGFSLANVQALLAADVANTYVDLGVARQRRDVAERSLEVQAENQRIAEWRAQAGLVSQVDVELARSQRAQTAASLPLLRQAEANARARLAVLLGEAPGALDEALSEVGAMSAPPPITSAGLPAALLARRPDLRTAEQQLLAATARIGVAKAQRFPALSLSGSVSSTAERFSGVGDSLVGNALANLVGPLFDAGQRRAAQRAQEAAADAAAAAYRKAVLGALEDVDRALVARRSADERVLALGDQRDAAARASAFARENYRQGLSDLTALLDAERSLLAAEDALASAGGDRLASAIQLYLALGGGWTPLKETP